MKVAIILALTFIAADCFIHLEEFSQEFLTLDHDLHERCKARTKVIDEDIEAHKKGNFAVDDEFLKKYIGCLWTEAKILNEKLEGDADRLYKLMPEKYSKYLVPIYLDCFRQVRMSVPQDCTFENKTFLISECIYYRDTNDWLFF